MAVRVKLPATPTLKVVESADVIVFVKGAQSALESVLREPQRRQRDLLSVSPRGRQVLLYDLAKIHAHKNSSSPQIKSPS